MRATHQEIYCAARNLLNRKTVFGRVSLFKKLDGSFIKPDPDGHLPDEIEWHATLFGMTMRADSCDGAVQKWAQEALRCVPRLAPTSEPVDCPYNDAGLAPGAHLMVLPSSVAGAAGNPAGWA